MPLYVASGDNGHLEIIDVLEGQIVQEPYTESQQERKQEHRQISPVDIELFKYSGKYFLHPSVTVMLLLLCFRKILYDRILVNLDLDIAVHLQHKGLVLHLGHCAVNTPDSHDLVAFL